MLIFKHIHALFALLSLISFVTRGIWLLRDSPLFKAKLTKVLPHIIDTGLLLTAALVLYSYQWNPFDHPWLIAKITMLLVYIGLGLVAFKFAKTKKMQCLSWAAALLAILYIFAIAITKSPTLHLM